MKKASIISKILIFSLILNFSFPAFSEDTSPRPYDNDELPQAMKDLRRFEIISLGALPFVTLDTTLAYSTWRYVQHDFDAAYTPDIFAASSFSQEEQRNLILTSLGVCIGIGLTDLIVQIVKRSHKKRRSQINYDDISIIPIAEDEDAQVIPLPSQEINNEEEIQEIEE
jgi:hypothetical protein